MKIGDLVKTTDRSPFSSRSPGIVIGLDKGCVVVFWNEKWSSLHLANEFVELVQRL